MPTRGRRAGVLQQVKRAGEIAHRPAGVLGESKRLCLHAHLGWGAPTGPREPVGLWWRRGRASWAARRRTTPRAASVLSGYGGCFCPSGFLPRWATRFSHALGNRPGALGGCHWTDVKVSS